MALNTDTYKCINAYRLKHKHLYILNFFRYVHVPNNVCEMQGCKVNEK